MAARAPHLRVALTFAIAIASLGMVGCSTAASATSSVPSAVTKIVTSRCTRCHAASQALSYQTTSKSEATALLDTMVGRGATLTTAERATLVAYFTR
jgi:uncharacterized membrane protein